MNGGACAHRIRVAGTDVAFEARPGETVLAAATRAGVRLPHSCTIGGCGSCRVKLASGAVDYEFAPPALSAGEAAAGFALACQARPLGDLEIEVPARTLAPPTVQPALVTALEPLGADVLHLQLVLPELDALDFVPGQHMDILVPGVGRRSFSMASAPQGNAVDFHVRRIAGGRFTTALGATVQPGDLLEVEIPLGGFAFHAEDEREVVMVATGTGLAPLKSMLESLFDHPDCPPVALYWGGRAASDLYLDAQVREWGGRLFEFRYVPVLSRAPGGAATGRYVQHAVLGDLPDLSEHSVYLCGSPAMIAGAKQAFLGAGARAERLYADGFHFQPAS